MMTVAAAANALNAPWQGQDALFTRVCTDTRTLAPGDLFVALRGEHFDAHEFIGSAKEKGAVAAVVNAASVAPPLFTLSDLPSKHWLSGMEPPQATAYPAGGRELERGQSEAGAIQTKSAPPLPNPLPAGERGSSPLSRLRERVGEGERADNLPLIFVEDTRLALGQLAAHWRSQFQIPLVAITGSNGKTTVKEMLAQILSAAAPNGKAGILATEGNLNNDIGVPQMLLRLRAQHGYAVIEMGMSQLGEIAYLSGLAKPTVAVISNAGAAHLQGLGSVAAVAQAKGEIFEGLSDNGIAVINADDEYAPLWRKLAGQRRSVMFGLNNPAPVDVNASYEVDRKEPLASRVQMRLSADPAAQTEIRFKLQVPGEHNVRNALAAAAAAVALGISAETIAAGLSGFTGVRGRLQKKPAPHGALIIDDSYNANPQSMRAALAVLAAIPGKKIFVMGDMGELGDDAAALHRQIGAVARDAKVDRLFALGELSALAVSEFGVGAAHFASVEALVASIHPLLAPNTTLLVKGSRFMQMERVVEKLLEAKCC